VASEFREELEESSSFRYWLDCCAEVVNGTSVIIDLDILMAAFEDGEKWKRRALKAEKLVKRASSAIEEFLELEKTQPPKRSC
jgi:hypothetical protein